MNMVEKPGGSVRPRNNQSLADQSMTKQPVNKQNSHVRVVDAVGLKCPMPLLKAKQGLNLCDSGEMIEVRTTDPQSVRDFNAFIDLTDHQLFDYNCIKRNPVIDESCSTDNNSADNSSLDIHCFVIRKA